MSKTFDFLKECGTFFVLTINGDTPAGRPFGAIMEYDGKLYFSTANTKEVYKQLVSNPAIQIISLKPGTRDWVRISGKAVECNDLLIKQRMLDECPVLTKRFTSADCDYFALFGVSDIISYLNTNNGVEKID